jgi:pimeloyl-ACP methyl ester carboxylesterase
MNDGAALEREVQAGRITTEGDELYYEIRGSGKPLLMIPGGGGDARWYSCVADILSDEYKVITYDRRANGRSTLNEPQNFEISQQSRDAVAVLRAAGESSAYIFGNSSGAVIALDMAKTQPEAVKAVIAHEPPLPRVHPKARKWLRFFAGVNWIAYRFGSLLASLRFVMGVGLPVRAAGKAARELESSNPAAPVPGERRRDDNDFFIKQELLPVINYMPDIESIKKNGARVYLAAGKMSLEKKRFYALTAPILAEMLGCELVIFPGHHISFADMPVEWAAVLRSILHSADSEQTGT